MNQKIPFHELAKRLSLATSISNDSAEVFIKNFFDLLSEAIVNGETVKIKGLGTFAPASIEGECCVEFTPDKGIADTLNAPFAPFEAVELNDEVTDEMLAEADSESQPIESTNDAKEEEPVEATDTTSVVAETPEFVMDEVSQHENEVEHQPKPEPEPEPNAEAETIEDSEPELVPEQAQAPVIFEPDVKKEPTEQPAEKTIAAPVAATAETPIAAEERQTAKDALEEEPEEFVEHVADDNSTSNGGFGWGFFVGLIVGLALGACAVYLAIDYLFPYGRMERTEQVTDNDTETVLAEEIAVPEQADSTKQPQQEQIVPDVTPVAEPAKEEPAQTAVEQATVPAKAIYDTVRKGYSLTHMAKKHYGSKDFWVYIYEENKNKIKNPNKVQPGDVFIIPAPEKYGINAANEESIAKAKNKAGQILSKFK